jgi:predicted cupin superfamily sugar epimerase
MESMGKTDERGARFSVAGVEGGERNEMTSIYWMARGAQQPSRVHALVSTFCFR